MRHLAVILSMLALAACGTVPAARGPDQPQATSMDAPVDFLLTSAATDFHAHRPPYPARVRNVRIGYVTTTAGTRQYRLCGAFLAEAGNPQWTKFATLRTSGYEQWIGGNAVSYGEGAPVVWIGGDFTRPLQSRLDSLR
jgi:hypothetical protein